MKPNAYLKLGTVAMDFAIMVDVPLFQSVVSPTIAHGNSGSMRTPS